MYKLKYLMILIILGLSLSLAGLPQAVSASGGAHSPGLGKSSSFSVLADKNMSAANTTTVGGNLGISTGLAASLTGPWIVGGSKYFGPLSLAKKAHDAALTAFNNLAGQSSNGSWGGNTSPVPGVWSVASDTTFSGTLTLSGGYNDVWVFQIGRDMVFSGSVVMAGNAQPCHVFWQIGRDMTLASYSSFIGTLIASRDITLVSGATVDGRIFSLFSSLTTDANTITGPTCNNAAPASTATNALLPVVTALPSTGGGPIRNDNFPWGWVIGFGAAIALIIGIHSVRSTYQQKQ